MALDSFKVKEIKKKENNGIKDNNRIEQQKLRQLVDSLSSMDIDQKWIKKNETKEFSFSSKNASEQQDDEIKSVVREMDKVSSFGKVDKQKNDLNKNNDIYKEWDELIDYWSQEKEKINKQDKTDIELLKASEESHAKEKENLNKEENKIEENVLQDNSILIKELNDRIDKKYNRLILELSNLYNSEVINKEADILKNDLQSLMKVKDQSLEDLKKVDDELNNIISKFSRLSQKSEGTKKTDNFKIIQQEKQLKELSNYQVKLQNSYGKFWFASMTNQEKDEYIKLYASAHNVSRDSVEKQIDDSIAKAYNKTIVNKEKNTDHQTLEKQETPFKGESENTIKFNGKKALETLKLIYASLSTATKEQIEEFSYLYNSLSSIAKYKPTNIKEEQEKLNQLFDVTDRINQLQASLNNTSSRSR